VPLNTRRVAVKFDFFRIAGLVCILAPGILLQWVYMPLSIFMSCHARAYSKCSLNTSLSILTELIVSHVFSTVQVYQSLWMFSMILTDNIRLCRYLLNHLEVAVVNWKSPTWMRSCGKWCKSFSSSSMIM